MMQPYIDRNNDSGVSAYEIIDDAITVRFSSGATYEYTHASAGSAHVETMKKLAVAGDGLNSYINRNVKRGYSRKIR